MAMNKKTSDFNSFIFLYKKIVLKYLFFYKYRLFLGCSIILLTSAMILPFPLFTKRLIDDIIPHKDYTELGILIGLILFITVSEKLLSYIEQTIFFQVNCKIMLRLRKDLLSKIGKITLQEYNKMGANYLFSRINDDVGKLQNIFADSFVNIFKRIYYCFLGQI